MLNLREACVKYNWGEKGGKTQRHLKFLMARKQQVLLFTEATLYQCPFMCGGDQAASHLDSNKTPNN